MQFSPKLLDEIRARVPVSQVVSRKVELKRAGREMKGLSPFKQERDALLLRQRPQGLLVRLLLGPER